MKRTELTPIKVDSGPAFSIMIPGEATISGRPETIRIPKSKEPRVLRVTVERGSWTLDEGGDGPAGNNVVNWLGRPFDASPQVYTFMKVVADSKVRDMELEKKSGAKRIFRPVPVPHASMIAALFPDGTRQFNRSDKELLKAAAQKAKEFIDAMNFLFEEKSPGDKRVPKYPVKKYKCGKGVIVAVERDGVPAEDFE